jgi:nucleoside-diphosphate kinase
MAVERTFSIIKPDATRNNVVGKIIARFEQEGLKIAGLRKIQMSRAQAGAFYSVHSARPFFGELVDFMTSGPCVVIVLEGENAIKRNREIMGATNPADAAEGTLRALYAASMGENAVHGSDAPETAAQEIAQFFSTNDLF